MLRGSGQAQARLALGGETRVVSKGRSATGGGLDRGASPMDVEQSCPEEESTGKVDGRMRARSVCEVSNNKLNPGLLRCVALGCAGGGCSGSAVTKLIKYRPVHQPTAPSKTEVRGPSLDYESPEKRKTP